MSKWEFIRPFIPDIWDSRKSRNQVKSKHINNIECLRSDSPLYVNFLEENEAVLGLATKRHYRVKNLIETNGYLDDGVYTIHDPEDREEIMELINGVIWRIRITNFVSILLWMVFAILIIVLIGVVTSVISGIIFEFITNWVSLAPSR